MPQFIFEGDVEILNKVQKKLVENVLNKLGYQGGKIIVEPVGQKGDNYIALVKRFIYETSDGSIFKMVGKLAPTDEGLRVMMNTNIMFNNETIMYSKVIPKLNDIQNSARINDDEKVRFPIFYGAVTEAPYEFILLEDLKESGFEILDRFQSLSNDSIRLVLKDLAAYHSLSYVLKYTEPETFTKITEDMISTWSLIDAIPKAAEYLENNENDFKNIVDDDKYKNVITGSLSKIGQRYKELQSCEKGSKYFVVQQGDCWNNNILFRLEDGKPVQNVMIDYQLSGPNSPVTDILYLILNCTDHATRLKHYEDWIDYYHVMLDDSLANHGLKANRVYPKEQLESDLKRYGKLAVGTAFILCTVILRESKDALDFNDMAGIAPESLLEDTAARMAITALNSSTIKKMKERVMGIVDTAFEFGLLNVLG